MVVSLVISALVALPQFGGGPELRRVDEGVSDRDPLSVSMRSQQVDMRQPIGFSGVYQVEGRELFVRKSGAVWAVFPRGLYGSNDGKAVVLAPAGMTFSIGTPQALREEADAVDPVRVGEFDLSTDVALSNSIASAGRLDRRIDHAFRPTMARTGDSQAAEGAPHEEHADSTLSPRPDQRPLNESPQRVDGWATLVTHDRVDAEVPRFLSDERYRRDRLSRLLCGSGAQSASGAESAGAVLSAP